MSNKESNEQRQRCVRRCRDKFVWYTARKPVGGVEALRICREGCDERQAEKQTG